MKRRNVLRSVSVAAGTALAGCSSVPGFGGSGTVLGRIEVINYSFEPNQIRLSVKRDDEILLDREISLTAIDNDDGGAWTIIDPVWSNEKGQYTVRAVHYGKDDDRESEDWEYTFTERDYEQYYGDNHEDPGCVGAVVKVGSLSEDENGTIGIGPTYMENPCELPANFSPAQAVDEH
ncbi:hypothetical protein B4589_011320 [Halolamina sp. CBA1230]|uniref:hypothetical protein n=1 Tax=Halolamina sp. CBA1230 TaxID=1853690 RepID=UPI0009A1E10C|nr:hypothetical protein [Halolamina sp. CBA1230]QKY20934.1 hypothetical protein B4589_011320 [Halolamina sp. CBA1230]